MPSTRYSCRNLLKPQFSQILEKYWRIKFHENPSSGSRTVPCGWTDRHYEANSRFLQFCERAYKTTAGLDGLGKRNNSPLFSHSELNHRALSVAQPVR